MKRLSNEEKYLLEIMQFDEFLSCIGECECKSAKDLAKQMASNRNNSECECKSAKDLAKQMASNRNNRRFDDNHVETKQKTINFK